MKIIIAFFLPILILSPNFSFACTKEEAVDVLYRELLDKVGNCRVLEINDLQKDWWGFEYYSIKFSCVNDDYAHRTRRVYQDKNTGECRFDI